MAVRRGSSFPLLAPKLIYISLLIGGSIFIWVAKTREWSGPLSIGVPAGLIAFYFSMSWLLGGLRVHDEQAGDNLYYMGFLFTLTSLGAALYRFNADESIEAIVRDFGLAVVTTICGIGFRVLYNQVRRDPIEIERTVRHELADMTRRVRAELEAASQEFSNFRRVSNQMLQEGFEEIGRQAGLSGQQIVKTLEALTIEAVKPIRSAGEQLKSTFDDVGERAEARFGAAADRMAALSEAIDHVKESLAATLVTFGEAVEAAGVKLAEVKTPDEVITVRLRPTLKTLEKLVAAQTQSLEAHHAGNARQFQAFEQTQETLQRLTAVLEKSVDANGHALQAADRQRQAVEHVGQQIEQQFAEIGKLIERTGQRADGLVRRSNFDNDAATGTEHETRAAAGETSHTPLEAVPGPGDTSERPQSDDKRFGGWFRR